MKKLILGFIILITMATIVYSITYGTRSNTCTGCYDYFTRTADNATQAINATNASSANYVNCAGVGGAVSNLCTITSGDPSSYTSVNYSKDYNYSGYKKGNLTIDYPNLDTDSTNDVTSVTGVSPISSSGGTTPTVSINADGIVNDTELKVNISSARADAFRLDP